jgi:general secretion pathway protein G
MTPAARLRRFRGFATAFVLALLVGVFVSVKVSYTSHDTPYKLTQVQLGLIESTVLLYREDTGNWPADLKALTLPDGNGPYLGGEHVNDPWGRPVVYRIAADGRGFELAILGRDGRVGGVGPAADTALAWSESSR